MIFVTVGGTRAFDRLIREMDHIAAEIDERVVMQIGSTNYEPKNCNYFKFMPKNEIEELYAAAKVIVCHAGGGSILTALQYSKPFILVPRMKRYGEVFDDHQLEIAREMQLAGAEVVYDIKNLEPLIRNLNVRPVLLRSSDKLVDRLKDYLQRLSDELKRQR